MSTIRPFSAIRPRREYIDKVASLPYDVMSVEEAKEIVKDNPYAFLQIDLPEVFLGKDEPEDSNKKYEYAKKHLSRLLDNNILEKDEDESYYIYQLKNQTVTQRGIVGLASVDEYKKGIIKKHENTRSDKEADRINHVDACNAHTGPIFLAYRKNNRLKNIIDKYTENTNPIYNFTAEDKVVHTVWKVSDDVGEEIKKEFEDVDSLYIADGHHRAAAAAAVGSRRKTSKSQYFLSVAFDEQELHIMDYNRLVKDLNSLSEDTFIDLVSKNFTVKEEEGIYRPKKKGSFGMYYNNKWYSLIVKDKIIGTSPVDSLDVSILQNYLLDPILDIKEPRTDNRIEFIGGIRGLNYLEKLAKECNGVAFSMFPTSIQELMDVADMGELMPPKSTWFEPKLRSGIFINPLD